MLRLTVAVLVLALAGTANAAGWRSWRIDGTSEADFAKSIAALAEEMPPAHRYVFNSALQDIQRNYDASEYRQRLDGLRYKEVVRLLDPTGDTAQKRYQAALSYVRANNGYSGPAFTPPRVSQQPAPKGFSGEQVRGGNSYHYPLQ